MAYLTGLRQRIDQLCSSHWDAVLSFAIGPASDTSTNRGRRAVAGFVNLASSPRAPGARVSLASTATCVRSLRFCTDHHWSQLDFAPLAEEIRRRYDTNSLTTTGLEHLNPFTIGQLSPSLSYLGISSDEPVASAIKARLRDLVEERGIALRGFPPNAYLSFWVLAACRSLGVDIRSDAGLIEWARHNLYKHLALLSAGDDEEGDAFQLAYSLVIQILFDRRRLRPSIIAEALDQLAGTQLARGTWEKKEPLFVWERYGDAYCFSYELLNTLMQAFRDSYEALRPFERALQRSLEWVERNAHFASQSDVATWRSGHRSENSSPESWATAEVYGFLRGYRRYLDYRVNQCLLEKYRGSPASAPDASALRQFYQPDVRTPGRAARTSAPLLGEVLAQYLLVPLALEGDRREYSLARNIDPKHFARSAILYGPPGTGKSSLVRAVARYLGWPIVIVDASDFVVDGFHLLPLAASRIFADLRQARDTVVLFDEMEELLRDRNSEGRPPGSRGFVRAETPYCGLVAEASGSARPR